MLEEESKAVQEVAKTTGKAIDLVQSSGGFLADVFGETFRQFGGAISDWARYFRYINLLHITDKVKTILDSRKIAGQLTPIPPQFALPLLDGASLEAEPEIQKLWAGLIANAADPSLAFKIRKVFLEILRGLEPLDAKILEFLHEAFLSGRYTSLTSETLNAEVLASGLKADIEDIKISLQTLARYSCVIDAWENTLASLDVGYSGFRVNNPKSNFSLSHLGRELIRATRTAQ